MVLCLRGDGVYNGVYDMIIYIVVQTHSSTKVIANDSLITPTVLINPSIKELSTHWENYRVKPNS